MLESGEDGGEDWVGFVRLCMGHSGCKAFVSMDFKRSGMVLAGGAASGDAGMGCGALGTDGVESAQNQPMLAARMGNQLSKITGAEKESSCTLIRASSVKRWGECGKS